MRAQGEGAKAPAPSPGADGIAEARRDFETLKSVRDASLVPGSRMPKVGVPEMTLPTPAQSLGQPKTKPSAHDARSSNWLVDAMEKQSSSKGGKEDLRSKNRRGRTSLARDSDESATDRGTTTLGNNEDAPTASDRAAAEASDNELHPVVVNPLNSFLGEWMTPQDYALLKPGLTPSREPGALPSTSPISSIAGNAGQVGGLNDWMLPTPGAAASILPAPPRENPYLPSARLDLPPPGALARSRPPEISSVSPPSRPSPLLPPTPADPPKSKIPDFVKPPSDDRYFKQLKRF